jgi:integrative and conjugative element protein (TIGR02256 family)
MVGYRAGGQSGMSKLQPFLKRRHATLWLSHDVLADLYGTAWADYPFETGGVLLGRRVDSRPLSVLVRHVLGPGPGAHHEARKFEPDYDWQVCRVAELWRDDQSLEYLGDWHTHPGGSPVLSQLDKDALRTIAGSADARQADPVMLILAIQPERSDLGATVFSDGCFTTMRLAVMERSDLGAL